MIYLGISTRACTLFISTVHTTQTETIYQHHQTGYMPRNVTKYQCLQLWNCVHRNPFKMHILFSVHILSSLPSVVRHDCFAVLLMLNITGLSSKRKLTVQKAGVKDINTLSSPKKTGTVSLYIWCFVLFFFPTPLPKSVSRLSPMSLKNYGEVALGLTSSKKLKWKIYI